MAPSSLQAGTVVLTHFASPYQVELFDEVAKANAGSFTVYYIHRTHPARGWRGSEPKHHAMFLNEDIKALTRAIEDFRSAPLAIFNFYNEAPAPELLRARVESGLPWCFWGERPGFNHPLLGRLARRLKLRALHRSSSPIWGIGRFAVHAYQREFGVDRAYHDIPYFSDLSRFQKINRPSDGAVGNRMILFSGALIHRKGVDLLARAFARLAGEFPNVRLKVVGDGELRPQMERTLQRATARVEFLGFKDWPDLPSAYASADVLCVPSRYDGWGLVVPEGLASGVPVIATDRTGAAIEFVRNSKNGWLIRAGDEVALYAALREAASLPAEQLAAMSAAARASVAGHSLENGAARFLAASRDAVANWTN